MTTIHTVNLYDGRRADIHEVDDLVTVDLQGKDYDLAEYQDIPTLCD